MDNLIDVGINFMHGTFYDTLFFPFLSRTKAEYNILPLPSLLERI